MSKALLVIDMPKNCRECPLHVSYGRPYCIKTMRDVVVKDKFALRPEWCPLIKAPEKAYNGTTFENSNAYTKGWNACVDEILGNKTEF